jgi:hypothetical protein
MAILQGSTIDGPVMYDTPQANLPRNQYDAPTVIAKTTPNDSVRKKQLQKGAYGNSNVIKDSEGILYFCIAHNKGNATLYLMLFDAIPATDLTATANKNNACFIATLPAGVEGGIDLGYWGAPFALGIRAVVSSTDTFYTADTSAAVKISSLYE